MTDNLDCFIERSIEEVVRQNGWLLIPEYPHDYDEEGNFIGDYSKEHEIAEKYIKKYNPDHLPPKFYKIKRNIEHRREFLKLAVKNRTKKGMVLGFVDKSLVDFARGYDKKQE